MNQSGPSRSDLRYELEDLRQRLADAESEARARDAFLAQLGHELRAPLSPIANLIAVLRLRDDLPEDTGPVLDIMERNLWREVRLVEDLVDTLRIARGTIELQRKRVEIDVLLAETVASSTDDFRDADIRLELSAGLNGVRVDGDSDRLRQLLRILLAHALAASPPRGEVVLRSVDGGQRGVTVTVDDSGRGLPPDRTMGPFTTLERPDGSGRSRLQAGLPIAEVIAEAHGGSLEVARRDPDRGTQYILQLPKASD
jgi:signal transduction histidine kinase